MASKNPREFDTPAMRRALADPSLRDPDLFAPDRHEEHPELDDFVRSLERQLWDAHMSARQKSEFNYAMYGRYRSGYVDPTGDEEVDYERAEEPTGAGDEDL